MSDSLRGILARTPDITMEAGHSGYFSHPQKTLDPALFNGDQIRPEARAIVMGPLFAFWRALYHGHMDTWATVWLAGSGVSYQWAGDRGNGDLDVLIGVDTTAFKRYNPKYASWGEVDIDNMLTDELRKQLWPMTANRNIKGKTYEVTYFVNERASDIRAIHPYAAYNLTDNRWTIEPLELPPDPAGLYPHTWFQAATRDTKRTSDLAAELNRMKNSRIPSLTQLSAPAVLAEATRLFNDIHTGRRAAFGSQGEGYGDYANFRWQVAKATGTIGALSQIVDVARQYQAAENQRLYKGSIADSEEALRGAMTWVMHESEQGYGG